MYVFTRDVVKYKLSAFFRNHFDSCMSVHALSLVSCMHSLELGLDLRNSLDRLEGESACTFIHAPQSLKKKSGRLILHDTLHKVLSAFLSVTSGMLRGVF